MIISLFIGCINDKTYLIKEVVSKNGITDEVYEIKKYAYSNDNEIKDVIIEDVYNKNIDKIQYNRNDEKISLRDIIFGFYTGIMCIMFIYNLFLYIIIKNHIISRTSSRI